MGDSHQPFLAIECLHLKSHQLTRMPPHAGRASGQMLSSAGDRPSPMIPRLRRMRKIINTLGRGTANRCAGCYLLLGGLSPRRALLSGFDRLSAPDRRSPTRCFSASDRVSVPDRRSFEARLSSPDRFSSLPIVVSVGLPRIMLDRATIARKPPARACEKGSPPFATGQVSGGPAMNGYSNLRCAS